jgi:hypothetical protein
MINIPACILEVSNDNLDIDIHNTEVFLILLSVCRKTIGYGLEISYQTSF